MADDIRQWLEELGLGKYGDVFLDDRLDVDVVADFDKDDLQQLGVSDPGWSEYRCQSRSCPDPS